MTAAHEPACPFCESADVQRIAQWGGQMITSQWRCGACGSYFEALREEFEDGAAAGPWRSDPAQGTTRSN